MRLIVDTNILFSALIRDSLTRSILVSPYFEFYMPEYTLTEINKHIDLIVEKSGMKKEVIQVLFETITERIEIVPGEEYAKQYKKAEKMVGKIDPDDTAFFALALSMKNDGLWTNDKKLKQQKKIPIWTTKQLKKILDEIR